MTNNKVKDEQLFIGDPESSFFINASAGTGKTSILVKRVLGLLLNDIDPKTILCVTFTKAAASEMQQRILKELADWVFLDENILKQTIENLIQKPAKEIDIIKARQLFAKTLENEHSFKILTIHSFAQSIIQKFSYEIGVSPNFKIMTSRDSDEIINEIKTEIYNGIENNFELEQYLNVIITYSSEFSLNEIFYEISEKKEFYQELFSKYSQIEIENNLLKNFNLTKNDLNLEKLNLNFITSNNQIIANIVSQISFIQEFGKNDQNLLSFLVKWCEFTDHEKKYKIEKFLSYFLTLLGEPRKKIISSTIQKKYPEICELLLDIQQASIQYFEQYKIIRSIKLSLAITVFARLFLNLLEKKKQENGFLDYEDLINLVCNLLSKSEYRDWVLYKMDDKFDHILIDEAQDTSIKQWQIINELSCEFFSGETSKDIPRSIFIVGDEKQSIYSFQGADHSYFNEIKNYYKSKIVGAKKKFFELELDISYRSSAPILKLVDEIFKVPELASKISLSGKNITHHVSRSNAYGAVEIWPIDQEESLNLVDKISNRISEMIANNFSLNGKIIEPKDILILIRKRDEFYLDLINSLKRNNIEVAGIDRMNLFDNIAIDDLIAAANFVLLPEDDYNLACLLKSPIFELSEEEIFSLSYKRDGSLWLNIFNHSKENLFFKPVYEKLQVLLSLKNLSPHNFFSYILYNLNAYKNFTLYLGREVIDFIEEFINLTLDFEKDHIASLQIFIQWIENNNLEIKRNLNQIENKVQIMTIHGSKGLQAKIVILADSLSLPVNKADMLMYFTDEFAIWNGGGKEQIDFTKTIKKLHYKERFNEYIRLLYVALTRAEDYLIIFGGSGDNIDQNCWYNHILQAAENLPFVTLSDNRLIYEMGKNTNSQNLKITFTEEEKIPSRFYNKPPNKNVPIKFISPTQFYEQRNIGKISFLLENHIKIDKGIIIHKILELINNSNENQAEKIVDKYLANKQINEKLKEEVKQNVLLIIKKFPQLFNERVLNEIKIGGKIKFEDQEYFAIGQVDKILLTNNDIIVVDFKSSITIPKKIDEIDKKIVSQLLFYGIILEKIFGREAKYSVIWTQNSELMEIPENLLEHFSEILRIKI